MSWIYNRLPSYQYRHLCRHRQRGNNIPSYRGILGGKSQRGGTMMDRTPARSWSFHTSWRQTGRVSPRPRWSATKSMNYGELFKSSGSAFRDDSRFTPSQWETALLCNAVFHWLGANLESALTLDCWPQGHAIKCQLIRAPASGVFFAHSFTVSGSPAFYFIPRIMHMVPALLYVVVFWYRSNLPMSFRVTSLALEQLHDCPSVTESYWLIIHMSPRE